MNAIEFVKTNIDNLVDSFPQLSCRYEFDEFSNIHIIEVLPKSVYKYDESYGILEYEITSRFIESFPDMSICFISSDSAISVENPIYEKRGILSGINNQIDQLNLRTLSSLNNFRFEIPAIINRIDIIDIPNIEIYNEKFEFQHGNIIQSALFKGLSSSLIGQLDASYYWSFDDRVKVVISESQENNKYSQAA